MLDKDSIRDLEEIKRQLASGDRVKRRKAAVDLAEHAENFPELVWPLVVKYGSSKDGNLRVAIATCVLDRVLQFHFDEYFPKAEELVLEGNPEFREALNCCWKYGLSEDELNASRWEKLLKRTEKFEKKSGIHLEKGAERK